jgi:hypothetical protein
MHSLERKFIFGSAKYGGENRSQQFTSTGREPDEGHASVTAAKLDVDPHLSARRLAQSLGIAASAVCRHLTEVMGATYVDACLKSGAYRMGITYATGAWQNTNVAIFISCPV